ncbi:MAG: 5-deoxy-glucuronate isomerase [Propionibacterium sp.]|nr:5-deoxy-glucuronate isomerase [Propionibacterium sp.]
MTEHVLRAGTTAHGIHEVDVSPERAGWRYSGLAVVALEAGQSHTFATDVHEYLVLPLAGGAVVEVGSERYELAGRDSIFGEVTDYAYVPSQTQVTVTATRDGRFALPYCVAAEQLAPRYCPADEVVTGLRGAGNMSRQVANYAIGNELTTSRLLVCEVLTPGGNWSSYPPHKHDENSETERELEEIYYFEIEADEHGPGMAFHSTYGTAERPIDVAVRVENGDLALVPHGWHGPCVAAPGYTLYYLNVMAGPGDATWLSVDDPCYGWLRGTWDDLDVDPRLPITPKEQ